MRHAILKKSQFNDFIVGLAMEQKVYAPVAKGYDKYAFEEVKKGEDIALDYPSTILPPKKFFLPQSETLVEYDKGEGLKMEAVVEYEKMVVFGVHTCDLAGIECLNVVFSERPKDLNYLLRKNKIAIIGLECKEEYDEHCTCMLMGNNVPNGGYDLFFTDLGDYFIIHVNTQLGVDLVEKSKVITKADLTHIDKLNDFREKRKKSCKNDLKVNINEIPEIFAKSHDSKVWEENGNKCLACGNCTNVCPTCYCFDVADIPNLDLKTGTRVRTWDSCQNETFAKVSGGESFREERAERQKHRFYRKFKYPVDKYSRSFCTGCGRCTRTCMAGISLPETLKRLVEENTKK